MEVGSDATVYGVPRHVLAGCPDFACSFLQHQNSKIRKQRRNSRLNLDILKGPHLWRRMRGSGVEGEPPATSPQPPLQSGGYPEQATLLVPGSNQPGIATNPQHRQVEDYSLPRFKTDRVFDVHSLWIWEILSFAAAGVLYGVFFFLLFQYDGQRVAQWEEDSPISQLFRTLQSAISFLTTLMKAAILLPVASAIGQLKWHYMRHPRRLKDLELIDGASRGGLGAVRLLFSRSSL